MTRCEPFTFTDDDGNEVTARVQEMRGATDEDRAALAEICRAALRKAASMPGCPNDPPCAHKEHFHRDGRCVVLRPVRCGCGGSDV